MKKLIILLSILSFGLSLFSSNPFVMHWRVTSFDNSEITDFSDLDFQIYTSENESDILTEDSENAYFEIQHDMLFVRVDFADFISWENSQTINFKVISPHGNSTKSWTINNSYSGTPYWGLPIEIDKGLEKENPIVLPAEETSPNAPNLISPSNNDTNVSNDVALMWNAPTEGTLPEGYKVFINDVQVANVTDTQYLPELDYNTTYNWYVIAYTSGKKNPIKGKNKSKIRQKTFIGKGDSNASTTWTFTTCSEESAGGEANGNNSGNPTSPVVVTLPPMDDGKGNIIYPEATITPNPAESETCFLTVNINTINGNVPNPNSVDLSIAIDVTGNTLTDMTVTLSFAGINPAPQEILYHNGMSWTSVPNATYDYDNETVTFPWQFGRASQTFVLGQEGTLPVEFSNFTVSLTEEKKARIDWTTQTECNIKHFEILRNTEEYPSESTVLMNEIRPLGGSNEQNYTKIDPTIEANITYYYWIKAVNLDNTFQLYPTAQNLSFTEEEEENEDAPTLTSLKNAYPNPYKINSNRNNSFLTFRFDLKKASNVSLKLYNLKGQLVKTLINEQMEASTISTPHAAKWDGIDKNNNKITSGVYFYKLETEHKVDYKKIVVIK